MMIMMSRSSLFVVVFVVCVTIKGLDSDSVFEEDENHIFILDEDNFAKALKQFKYLLVEFYAPWCLNCQDVAPEYGAAAKALFDFGSDVRLAKVDATEELDLADTYGVRAYPTMVLFKEGKLVTGTYKITGKKSEEIVSWVERKTGGSSAKTITSAEEITTLQEKVDILVVGFFKQRNSDSASNFLKVADDIEDLTFAISTNQEYNLQTDTIVIFKKLEEKRVDLSGDLTLDNIRDFIEVNRLPVVIQFNAVMAPKIFENKLKKHVLLMHRTDDKNFEERMDVFTSVAKHFKGKALFVCVDIDLHENKRIYEFFELKRSDCPAVRFSNLDGNLKYKPDKDDWKKLDLFKFVQEVLDGTRLPYLDSEKIPKKWDDQPVKILVGKNFDEIARDKTKDAFVHFYASWSTQCDELAPIWIELAEKFLKNPEVVIAKIDGTKNEVKGLQIASFPTLKFFPRDSDQVFEFTGNRTLERLVTFVESGGKLSETKEEKSKSKNDKEASKKKDEL